jgi:hypothetical protein
MFEIKGSPLSKNVNPKFKSLKNFGVAELRDELLRNWDIPEFKIGN